MKKHNKDVLKATLFALIAIFIMIGAAGLLFAEHKKKIQKEQQKKAAIEALERVPTVTPTPAATATPTPEPTATVTPTPVITRAPAFVANDYMGTWYSKDGLVTLSIDDLTLKSVTFTFLRLVTMPALRFRKLRILQKWLEMQQSFPLQIPGETRCVEI